MKKKNVTKIENHKKVKIDQNMHVEDYSEYRGIDETFRRIRKRKMFEDAVINGETGLVRAFLEDQDVQYYYDSGLRLACGRGRTKIVEILLADGRIHPNAMDNIAFKYAAKNNHIEVLKLLVSDPRFDPTFNDNHLLVRSVTFHNFSLEVIKLLLEHPKANPSAQDNICLYNSIIDRNLKLIAVLLEHPKMAIDVKSFNISLSFGLENGYLNLVKRILALEKQKELDLFNRGSCYYIICAFNNHMDCIRVMLEDGRILNMLDNEPESEAKQRILDLIENRIERKAAGIWACKEIGQGWGDIADILQSRMIEY